MPVPGAPGSAVEIGNPFAEYDSGMEFIEDDTFSIDDNLSKSGGGTDAGRNYDRSHRGGTYARLRDGWGGGDDNPTCSKLRKNKKICGPDVTDWFRRDLQEHQRKAVWKGWPGLSASSFKSHAKYWLAHKWMRIERPAKGPEGPLGPTKKCPQNCPGTVMLGGVCVNTKTLGNIALGFITAEYFPVDRATALVAGAVMFDRQAGSQNWAMTQGIDAAHRGSNRVRYDSIGAMGVGEALWVTRSALGNKEQFKSIISWALKGGTVLNRIRPLDRGRTSRPVKPEDLAKDCEPCPGTTSQYGGRLEFEYDGPLSYTFGRNLYESLWKRQDWGGFRGRPRRSIDQHLDAIFRAGGTNPKWYARGPSR